MDLEQRLAAFSELGKRLHSIESNEKSSLINEATRQNPWFTAPHIDMAWKGVRQVLDPDKLKHWTAAVTSAQAPRNVGVAMAGNIPMVGFHDLLSVLVSGHRLTAKLSARDTVLMSFLVETLCSIEPAFRDRISLTERLASIDALISTGSDISARHFEYYFRNIPHIIRRNRTSCAIVAPRETDISLASLGADVFTHFGLGCRNVSKLLVPKDFDISRLQNTWSSYKYLADHNKYWNNYLYQRTVLQMNNIPFLDSGFFILAENNALVSPMSVLNFERYHTLEDLAGSLKADTEKIQCIASDEAWYPGSVPYGRTQFPDLTDYADGVDTLAFLSRL